MQLKTHSFDARFCLLEHNSGPAENKLETKFYGRLLLGHPKPKKMLIFFRFVGIFEYIILLMLILFLDMCQNS